MLTYRKRDHWEDREDSEWRIEADALVYVDALLQEYRFPWKDIVGVRAEWSRKGGRPLRHMCSVWLSEGERSRCEFDDQHVVTVGEYEDRKDYPIFLRAVLTKIVEKSPSAKAWTGISEGLYPWIATGGALFLILMGSRLLDANEPLTGKILPFLVSVMAIFLLVRDRPKALRVSELKALVTP